MKPVASKVELLTDQSEIEFGMKRIEIAGRTCYKSEPKIGEKTYEKFIAMLIRRGHESVIEHFSLTFRIRTDRGVTHELVRHRIASFSQASTRYCNYGKSEIEFINILEAFPDIHPDAYVSWLQACTNSEGHYKDMLRNGCPPELARSVLPNSLATEIVVTFNMRSLRNFLKLRTSPAAHPQMRIVANKIKEICQERCPVIVSDI